MKKRIILSSIALFSLLLVFSVSRISAAPGNNPIFATIEWVEEKMHELTHSVQQNESDLNFLKRLASRQQTEIDELIEENQLLQSRISNLENNSLPDGKWVHVCFDVATKNLSVMKGGACSPHVHWKIFVQCYPGTPCIPDNPLDSYFDFPQEQD